MNLIQALTQKLDARGRELAKAQTTISNQRREIRHLKAKISHQAATYLDWERQKHDALSMYDAACKMNERYSKLERDNDSLKRQLALTQGKP